MAFVVACAPCQRIGNISKSHELLQNGIFMVKIFAVWGIDFIGPFPSSYSNKYILVSIDNVSKWVEAIALPTNDFRGVLKLLKRNIFTKVKALHAIISDEGTHFCNKQFDNLLAKYGVRHEVVTPFHPQTKTSGQVKLSNQGLK